MHKSEHKKVHNAPFLYIIYEIKKKYGHLEIFFKKVLTMVHIECILVL